MRIRFAAEGSHRTPDGKWPESSEEELETLAPCAKQGIGLHFRTVEHFEKGKYIPNGSIAFI
jgi:hypothetical protein